MDSRTPDRPPSADAVEFVRFCYRRRRVGWPELYDEMCAVAGRGLFRGWRSDELSAEGIGFSLFEMPALAVLVHRIVAEEHEKRVQVAAPSIVRTPVGMAVPALSAEVAGEVAPVMEPATDVAPSAGLRLTAATAGA
ncbi:MAG TPA: hypothetical protein VGQ58_05015 [Candidatus Limnocylindrales bacterium]|jgi:hypothetical protein|nr:hypothetical protein [Candidatus Limnocylindrales bacterium]